MTLSKAPPGPSSGWCLGFGSLCFLLNFLFIFQWQFEVSKSTFLQTSALVAGLLFPGGIGRSLLLLPHKVPPEAPGAHAQRCSAQGGFKEAAAAISSV